MKRILQLFILITAVSAGFTVKAQDASGTLSLTVRQAVDYAIDHNRSVAAARYDLLASEKGVWESIAAGLPSVEASASLSNNLAIMTRIIDFGGSPMPFKFGTNYDAAVGVSASTLLFNAPWLIGIQTAKMASNLARQGMRQSILETKENITTLYFLILTMEETQKVVDANIENLRTILLSTRAMYETGMAESTDVDQMQSTVTMLENTSSSMLRTREVNYNMMRFLLGVPAETEIILTETLAQITEEINIESLMAEEFIPENNLTWQLTESQLALSELGLKSARAASLPTLAGTIYYNRTGMGDKLMHMQYFPYSAVALQLQVPIFASGLRHVRVTKAKITLDKTRNTRLMVSDQLMMQERQLRFNLLNANEQFNSQKANIEIAARVLESFSNKYEQGMASSLELTQANNNYLTAQNNYISALLTLLQTKVAFDKLMNNL